jgi:hypothetical protein
MVAEVFVTADVTALITGGSEPELDPVRKSTPSMVPGATVIAPATTGTLLVVTILTQGLADSLLQVSIVLPAMDSTRVVTLAGTLEPASVKV